MLTDGSGNLRPAQTKQSLSRKSTAGKSSSGWLENLERQDESVLRPRLRYPSMSSDKVRLETVGDKISLANVVGWLCKRSPSSHSLDCRAANMAAVGGGSDRPVYSHARPVRLQRLHSGMPLSHRRLCFLHARRSGQHGRLAVQARLSSCSTSTRERYGGIVH